MKRAVIEFIVACLGLLFAGTCSAQMYTITDLGPLHPTDINNSAQVVGNIDSHAFLWTAADGLRDLGLLANGTFSNASAINDLGQVIGTADGTGTWFGWGGTSSTTSWTQQCDTLIQPFVWSKQGGMIALGAAVRAGHREFYGLSCWPGLYGTAINNIGQIAGYTASYVTYSYGWAGWDARIEYQFGYSWPPTNVNAISNAGQMVGADSDWMRSWFRRATSWRNGVPTDLGFLLTLPSAFLDNVSSATSVNDLGAVVGWSVDPAAAPGWGMLNPFHAVLWNDVGEIRDLGTLPSDAFSMASKINFFGQIVGSSGDAVFTSELPVRYQPRVTGRAFIWSNVGGMQDLNVFIAPDSGWVVSSAAAINLDGQIVGEGTLNGQPHGYLLTPIYKALVQKPINADGSSAFAAARGVVPLKFALNDLSGPTCNLQEAKLSIARVAGTAPGPVDETVYATAADTSSSFQISGCQYHYNLATSSLGIGTYQLDININGIAVGHAIVAIK